MDQSFGTFFDEEWHNLSRMFVDHDQDSDQQFTGHELLMSSEHDDHGLNFEIDPSNVFSNADSFIYVSDNINPNFYHFLSQESSSGTSNNGTVSIPYPCHDQSFQFFPSNSMVPSPSNDVCDQPIGFCMMDEINNSSLPSPVISDDHVVVEKVKMENSQHRKETPLKRKLEMLELSDSMEDEVNNEKIDKNPKKKSRVNKNKKNVQPKKNQKIDDTEKVSNNNNGEMNGQTSSSCSSDHDDDLNGSQDLNRNRKTRASRGTATDPQSLYARKRRERINERLRILQNLVPNGTKVDISTMLEEAVEYVKFLKLQIQLLSSDDMWMYAPIAYNGMDMGLYQSITPTL